MVPPTSTPPSFSPILLILDPFPFCFSLEESRPLRDNNKIKYNKINRNYDIEIGQDKLTVKRAQEKAQDQTPTHLPPIRNPIKNTKLA